MNAESLRVAPLHRVTVSLSAGTSPGSADLTPEPRPFTFIVGIGTAGMSPFEYALLDKTPGEVVELQIAGDSRCGVFEHLDPPLAGVWNTGGRVHLQACVTEVVPAQSREIVRAMAASSGCGGDCGCGCG